MKKIMFIILAGIILNSCSTLEIASNYDKTVDFKQYKIMEYWGWADDSDKILNRFDKERIEKAFGDEFRKRGIEVVEKGKNPAKNIAYIMKDYPVQPKE